MSQSGRHFLRTARRSWRRSSIVGPKNQSCRSYKRQDPARGQSRGIVDGVGVFRDVESFLDDTPHVGEERPVCTDSAAIFIRLSDIVGANSDQSAVSKLQFTTELNKPFRLPAVLRAVTSAAQDENHWMLFLQFGELPAFRGVVGKLIVRENRSWNDVKSHTKPPQLDACGRATATSSSISEMYRLFCPASRETLIGPIFLGPIVRKDAIQGKRAH